MNAPKVTVVALDHQDDYHWFSPDDWAARKNVREVHSRLAEAGQRITIPDDAGPGWWGVPEDMPTPEPISERWINCYASGGAARRTGSSQRPRLRLELGPAVAYTTQAQADRHRQSGCLVVIHVWTDAEGADHAEIERVP